MCLCLPSPHLELESSSSLLPLESLPDITSGIEWREKKRREVLDEWILRWIPKGEKSVMSVCGSDAHYAPLPLYTNRRSMATFSSPRLLRDYLPPTLTVYSPPAVLVNGEVLLVDTEGLQTNFPISRTAAAAGLSVSPADLFSTRSSKRRKNKRPGTIKHGTHTQCDSRRGRSVSACVPSIHECVSGRENQETESLPLSVLSPEPREEPRERPLFRSLFKARERNDAKTRERGSQGQADTTSSPAAAGRRGGEDGEDESLVFRVSVCYSCLPSCITDGLHARNPC